MPIELAKIQLNRVHRIETLEQASLVHHRIPGLEGNMIQNLGRDSVWLQIEGIFYGNKAHEQLETLRKAYKQREPVDFLADVVGQAYFSQVLLERFEVAQVAQSPEQFSYRLTLAEYVPPKKSAAANQAAVNQAVKVQAKKLMDVASLPEALSMGSIPELTNPAAPLNTAVGEVATALDGVQGALGGFGAMMSLQAEASAAPPEPLPKPDPLTWGAPPSPEDLVQAGVSAKNLLASGVSANTLLEAGASVLALQQAGVSATTLAAAGVSEATLNANQQALTVLSTLETLPQITLQLVDEAGIALALEDYRLTLPNSTPREGKLDAQGQLQVEIAAGASFTLEFPNLDGQDWAQVDEPVAQNDQISFVLVDESGAPLAAQAYLITLADGSIRSGQLDQQGQAKLEGISAGLCEVSFPDLDADDWALGVSPEKPGETGEPEELTDQAWLTFTLTSPDETLLPNTRYSVYQGDVLIQQGQIAAGEQIRIAGLAAGTYELSFPDLDSEDWELVP
jgi:DNA circularisation protein N-terminus